MSPSVAVITGPTATGKTALGVILAEALGGEVVSADSMQIYRRMDIGTAKPSPEEMRGIHHHMIDVAEPEENYSAARYVSEAGRCVDDILSRGKLPIIVGGTGLYIDSLLLGRNFAVPGDEALRRTLSEEYDALGPEAFHARLREIDPQRAEKLSPNDRRRVVRAMEVYALTGITITEHDERSRLAPPRYDAAVIALSFAERDCLYSRIDSRVDLMVERGLFEEVESLIRSGVPSDCTAMQAIGYKEAVLALRGEISRQEAVELIKRESRRYAKRQLTWLRRDKNVKWILWDSHPDFDSARQLSTEFLSLRGIKY